MDAVELPFGSGVAETSQGSAAMPTATTVVREKYIIPFSELAFSLSDYFAGSDWLACMLFLNS